MASYNTSANIVLTVNGKQAQKMLSQLEKDAKRLEQGITKAASAGDKATMKKLQRELNSTKKTMEQLKGTAASAETVLQRLDKATPKELNKALRDLQRQLNGIQRGTAAWDAHMDKIRAVKQEIQKVNEQMKPQQSLGERFSGWINKWQTALVGIGAIITGLVMAGRKAVNAYADMEQEMANVRKFTGMSAEEVAALNEEFKKIDTRTSREELNKLAQEAGRLGKSSQEDVLGFVRAADKINVALDDLGDGATLILSKLTGIFGDEKRLGTERALLSVGSVINELSQNCSASAPYIAEFASRMGGVGAQANLTVQQIMAFAAVLDSNNQKLEASSTALSQVIVRIYQEPAKYAKVAGMDVANFQKLVKTDMNAALIEFLSTLKKAGNMNVLAPMFKDMGENGSRAIAALSTLANHIDEVKAQQEVANQAFSEATSIDKEFEVQNNTVQAGLDKAKNKVRELAVELGEKLQPVMKLVISSSTIAIKVLSTFVDFVIAHKNAILAATVALGAYKAAVLVHNAVIHAAAIKTAIFNVAVSKFPRLAALGRVAIAALTNTVQYFSNGLQVNYAMQQRWATALNRLKSIKLGNPYALVAAGLAATIAGLIALTKHLNALDKSSKKSEYTLKQFGEALKKISEEAANATGKEISKLEALYKAATNEASAKQKRIEAARELISIYPEQFKNMSAEDIMLGRAISQYQKLRISILEMAEAKAAAKYVESKKGEIIALRMQRRAVEERRENVKNQYEELKKEDAAEAAKRKASQGNGTSSKNLQRSAIAQTASSFNSNQTAGQRRAANMTILWQDLVDLTKEQNTHTYKINALNREIDFITNRYGSNKGFQSYFSTSGGQHEISTDVAGGAGSGSGSQGHTGSSSGNPDPLKAEKEWREMQQALARVAHARLETDEAQHALRMAQIDKEFYEKVLEHQELSGLERAKYEAEQAENLTKIREMTTSKSLRDEEVKYAENMAQIKQNFLDGNYSVKTYEAEIEKEELLHQQRLLKIYDQGSKEYKEVQQRITDTLIEQRRKRKSQEEQETKELQDYFKERQKAMKDEYFGLNSIEKAQNYYNDTVYLTRALQAELAIVGDNLKERKRLEEAYWKAINKIRKKYGYGSLDDSMKGQIMEFAEWLESDGGKAVTGAIDTLSKGMGDIFSQLTTMMQAELEIQTTQISKRYDAEIAHAEGNTYRIAQLEKKKEAEIAKAKQETNRKMFAMQVIQAVAQTATNALNAYGSAAAVPVIGYILAPIAAAMAVAAGAIQIAAIKKQQQASEAQGYAEGGFTPKGGKYEEAGIVHKGEWVASQKLVNNPKTRPLLEALDYAQRTNTIGSITSADVSRSITAPIAIAAGQSTAPTIINNTTTAPESREMTQTLSALQSSIAALKERLDEPFVTQNTVSGPYGMEKALADYNKLMRNKSPKSRL